jgi:hypothetical protein
MIKPEGGIGVLMIAMDEWGRDPSVQRMRAVFSSMEVAQKEFLEKVGLSSLDNRLRQARDKARILFEKAWSHAATRGLGMFEDETAGLYLYCLSWALGQSGVEVPENFLPADERLEGLIREIIS